jgi:hypothetical protein
MSLRIQVDGIGTVQVDPSFQELSPQEQESFIDEIRQSVSAGRMASDAAAPTPASTPIDASRSNFDLDAAIPDSQPATAQTAAPQPTEPNSLAGTPFDYERGAPILEQFVADFMDKENIVTGAKYGDKAVVEEDWINAREQIYAPKLNALGINPAKAQIAANQVARGKSRNMLEALGIPEPQNNTQVNLSPEQVEEAKGLQTYIQNNISLANETDDPQQKRQFQRMASEASQKLRAMSGAPEPTPFERIENINSVLGELGRKKERGNMGTVDYDGVAYPVGASAELEADLASEQADLLDLLENDPNARASIRVRPQNAIVYDTDSKGNPRKGADGTPVINQKATAAKWEELQNMAREGEIIEREDGTIGPFMGAKKTKDGGSWVPKGLQPALKGASVVVGEIADTVAPLATRQNLSRASSLVGSVVPTMGAPVQAAIAMSEDGGSKLKSTATTAMKTALASGLSGGVTGPNYLAVLGLEYLSSIGRKAQEEEEKKRAGQ